MNLNLSKEVKITQVMDSVAAGVIAQNSSVIDMQGFAGVVFVAAITGALITSVVTLKAQEDIVNPMTAAKDLSGASTSYTAATAYSGKALVVDVYRPKKRYLRCVVTPTVTNAGIGAVFAIQYQAGAIPAKIDPSVLASALAVSPAEL